MKSLRAVIVEDEELGIKNLEEKLARNCPQVEIVGVCKTAIDAIKEIPQKEPDLVFLDINLGNLNGFDVLDRLRHINFEIIFTTVFNNYVIKAIRANAIDYLLKPIKDKELVDAVMRVWDKTKERSSAYSRISIPVQNGARFVGVDEILYCEADNNRTIFHLFNKEKIRASRVLKKVEEQLSEFGFLRIHRAYLINPDYLEEYNRTDGRFVLMSNKARLPVAREKVSILP